jgi:hypothetical protein
MPVLYVVYGEGGRGVAFWSAPATLALSQPAARREASPSVAQPKREHGSRTPKVCPNRVCHCARLSLSPFPQRSYLECPGQPASQAQRC